MAMIYGSTGNEYIDVQIVWSASHVESANSSYVTASLYYKRNNTGFTTTGTGTFSLTIDGDKKSETKTLTITENEWVLAVSHSTYVTHKPDGTGSVSISASGSIPGTTLTSTSIGGTYSLETIPKATTISSLSCATSYFNGTMTYKYLPRNANYYTRCNIALNLDGTYTAVKSIYLGQQTKEQKTATVTLSESELSIIYNKLPSSTKGILRFTFRTYSDSEYSTQVGDPDYMEITLNIPNISATQPTATITLSPVNALDSPFNSLYIKGKTKVDVNFTDGEGKYGASIVSYKVTIGGKSYGSPYTSEYITTDGEVEVKSIITDSRGFSRTYTDQVNFISYANPRIIPASDESEIICARCDASGNLSESGTYLKIKAKRNYSKVTSSGVQKNFCSIRYRYKPEGGSYTAWTTILADSATSDEVTTGALLGGALSLTSSYVVQVGVIDTLGESANTTIPIPTEKVYMHKAGSISSLGLGKYVEEENLLDIAWDTRIRGDLKLGADGRKVADFITEDTIAGSWRCRKWDSGIVEAYGSIKVSVYTESVYGNLYYQAVDVNFPTGVFLASPYVQVQTLCSYGLFSAHIRTLSASAMNLFISNSNIDSRGELEVTLFIAAFGKWK